MAIVRPSSTSPRERYNSNFLAKLQKFFEKDPESDLQQHLSRYNSLRLKKLRGVKATQPIADTEQKSICSPPLEPPTPELCSPMKILSPLAPQLQALIGLSSSETSNNALGCPSSLYHLLKSGEVIHQLLSKWVVRISSSIVVKFAQGLDISEIHTMYRIWPYKQRIPMPEPLGAISVGSYNYIFMSYVDGASLASLWLYLSPELKTSVQCQLRDILLDLRNVPLHSEYLGGGDPLLCKDLRRQIRTNSTSISTEKEFNEFLLSTQRELNPVYLDLCTSKLRTDHQIVMSHGDIRPENILVSYLNSNTIKITGIVDWEFSGAYPEYWEYVKALAGVSYNVSDWYSYLPLDVIGDHRDSWRQDEFISRLVL